MSAKLLPTIDDPNIVGRVKKYLEDNIDKHYLDIGHMVTSLRDKYPEYSTRQQKKFRKVVETAYKIVSLSYGLECQPSGEESEDDDVELMEDQANGKSLMKNIMNDLYNSKSSKDKKDGNNKTAEAIDISSDEDDTKHDEESKKNFSDKPANINPEGNPNLPRGVTLTRVPNSGTNKVLTSNGSKEPPNVQNSSGNKRRELNHPDTHPAKKFMSQQLLHQIAQENIATALQNFRSDIGGIASQQNKQPPKKYKKIVMLFQSHTTFQHIGGLDKKLKELCEILMHFKVPDVYFELGIVPPRGILLHGPSGCGKTMLASAIAGQLNINIINVPATELIAGVSGESEERIRDVFDQAKAAAPCVLFIDEIDAISSNRVQAQKDMERRVVSQLVSSIDALRQDINGNEVLIIGATSRPDALDPALRREGRFDYEMALTIPSRKERKEMLRIICNGMLIDSKLDFDKIAELTPGYVAADLVALAARAASITVKKRWSEHMRKLRSQRPITIVDLDDLDEPAAGGKTAKAKGADDKTKETSAANETSSAVIDDKPNETSSAVTEEDKPKDDIDKNTEGSPDSKAKKTVTESSSEAKSDEKTEKMDVDSETVSPQKIALPAARDEKENDEPTLAEMINWLDSPPEDLDLDGFCITQEDFCEAVKVLQPSAKREGFITVPDVTWDDIGSLRDVREELRLAILAPVKFPEKMATLGLNAPSGVLLCGPPGCGKTLIAKAIANEAGINFISVKGPELMNMYVGESERAVRDCFQRARNSAPCVIFFDEFDSLCPKRTNSADNTSGVRIVNQLLTEMDGIQARNGVYIVAATNRPDIIDPAILRPGRLDTILYVGMPDEKDRYEILCTATKNRTAPMLDEDVDLKQIARLTDKFSGADLSGLIRQAAMLALKDSIKQDTTSEKLNVTMAYFEEAMEMVRPSISEQDRIMYEGLRKKYAAPRVNTKNGLKSENA